MKHEQLNLSGFCQCGCGELTRIATRSSTRWGHVKGQPLKYIYRHSGKDLKLTPEQLEARRERAKGVRGPNSPTWAGGKPIRRPNGYVLIWVGHDHPMAINGGRAHEHRIVMAKKLGRMLTSNEIVHHINGVKDDNRPENLTLLNSHREHMHYHFRGEQAA